MNALRLRSLLIAGAFCLSCTANAQTDSVSKVLLANGYQGVSLQRVPSRGFIFPAKINGKSARLAVSMSAPLSSIFRQVGGTFKIREKRSGQYLKGPFGRSNEEYGLSSGNSLEVANMVLADTQFVVIDKFKSPAATWPELSGLLGEPELQRSAAIFDCANGRLYVRPGGRNSKVSAAIGRGLAARGFTSAALHMNSERHLAASCRINSHESVITIEPANTITQISERNAAAARVALVNSSQTLASVGGIRQPSRIGHVQRLAIGSCVIPNAPVWVARANFNTLGLDQLVRGSAVIDIGAKKLYLRARTLAAN